MAIQPTGEISARRRFCSERQFLFAHSAEQVDALRALNRVGLPARHGDRIRDESLVRLQ